MKNIVRFLCIALVLVMTVAAFAACGKKDGDTKSTDTAGIKDTNTADAPKTDAVAGEKKACGNITLLVPSDMNASNVDLFGDENLDKVTLTVDGQEMHYITITIRDEEDAISDVDLTKEMNDDSSPVDVEFKTGDINWKGVAYNYSGVSDGFHVYAAIGDRFVTAQGAFFAYDDEVVEAVLASIELAAAN